MAPKDHRLRARLFQLSFEMRSIGGKILVILWMEQGLTIYRQSVAAPYRGHLRGAESVQASTVPEFRH